MVIVNTRATIGKSAIAVSPLTERTLLQKALPCLKVKPIWLVRSFAILLYGESVYVHGRKRFGTAQFVAFENECNGHIFATT